MKRELGISETICKETQLSVHRPNKKSFEKLNDEQFGYYLAGLIESIGRIMKTKEQEIQLNININNISLGYALKKRIGFGQIKLSRVQNSDKINCKQATLIIKNKKGIEKVFSFIWNKFKFEDNISIFQEYSLIQFSKNFLPLTDSFWLAGFIDGLGELDRKNNKIKIQYNNLSFLNELVTYFGGTINNTSKLVVSYFVSSELKTNYNLLKYFDKFSLQIKYLDYVLFRKSFLKLSSIQTQSVDFKVLRQGPIH